MSRSFNDLQLWSQHAVQQGHAVVIHACDHAHGDVHHIMSTLRDGEMQSPNSSVKRFTRIKIAIPCLREYYHLTRPCRQRPWWPTMTLTFN